MSELKSMERLEERRLLAADSGVAASGTLEPSAIVYVANSMIDGPSPIVFSESQIIGHEVPSFVISAIASGVVEKFEPASGGWVPVSLTPNTSNPAVLMSMLNTCWIQPGDRIRWIPESASGGLSERAFEVLGWDDGVAPPPVDPSAPAAVEDLAVSLTGIGELTLSWNPPATGSPTSYSVTRLNVPESTITVTGETSLVVSGLSPLREHFFSVTASNDVGAGPAVMVESQAVEGVATPPTDLAAIPRPEEGETMLSWQPPLYDGGSPVVLYTVTAYHDGQQQTVTTDTTSATFQTAAGDGPLLFRIRAITFAGEGLPATLAATADGVPLPLPPSNPFMGLEGTSTMHANAASSDATIFPGPGTTDLEKVVNLDLNATMPSVLMTENGGLVCVGVGTSIKTAQTPIVMLISPETLEVLDQIKLIKPQSGNLAGGLYNYIDYQNRLVLVNADGVMQWYSNDYDQATDTGSLTLEKSVDIGQPMVVGLVPDYEGRIWFATQGSLSSDETPAVMGFYNPWTDTVKTYELPAGEMVANSISSSPAGVAVATTTALYLFNADAGGTIQQLWRKFYENSGDRKPGQLSPGTGSTPVFFGPDKGYEYLVITDNATASGTDKETPAEHVHIYSVADGSRIARTPFLGPTNAGTENAPIAVGNQVFVPSTFGYWYPPPSETPSTSVPNITDVSFAGGFQGMTLGADGSGLVTNWTGSSVFSSALPRLSLTDNVIYTIVVDSSTTGEGRNLKTTETYSFAAVDADTGEIMGTPLEVGSNTFSGTSPNYANTGSYAWNTLQMTGVISPTGVFYQGTAGGLFLVRQRQGT